MARKRNSGSEPVTSGGVAPARTRRRVTHSKHASAPASEEVSAPIASSPAEESSAIEESKSPVTDRNFPATESKLLVTEAPVPSEAEYNPEPEEIARLAYSYWEGRGRQGGSAEEDWNRAEQELRVSRNLLSRA